MNTPAEFYWKDSYGELLGKMRNTSRQVILSFVMTYKDTISL